MNGYTACCTKIAEHYGWEQQSNIANEELSELIKAICKWNREPNIESKERITEEIADVEIMIDQIKHLLNIYDVDVDEYKHDKIQRQFSRIRCEMALQGKAQEEIYAATN